MDLNLKPIYDTGTVTFVDAPKNITLKKIDASYTKDPKGIIPNGIYKVFRHEKKKQAFLLIFNTIIIAIVTTLFALFVTDWKAQIHWFWNVPLVVVGALAMTKFVFVGLEMRHLVVSVRMYRESLMAGSRLTPPFISSLYLKLFKKQTRQNWVVIAFIFYGTIITLMFWWLKDANWWIFEFNIWIKNLTKNPEAVGGIMISILIFTLFLHIYLTIYRKKRIIDIQSFFGNEVISQVEIDNIVAEQNKKYKRLFLLSIIIVLVFPFIIRIIYRKIKGK